MGGRGGDSGNTGGGLTNTGTASDAQVAALNYYQTQGYYEVNSQLRSGDGTTYGDATDHMNQIDSLMSESQNEVTTFRGYNEDSRTAGTFASLEEGDELTDKGYTSTSLDRGVAEGFADEGTEWIEQSTISKGVSVVDMNAHISNPSFAKEKEVLVHRNNSRVVTKVDVANKVIYTRYTK